MRVIYFYNWGYFAPISSGADVMAASHLEYFRRRNWKVDCVIQHARDRSDKREHFRRTYPWLNSLEEIKAPGGQFSFRSLLWAYNRAAQSPAVRKILSRPADLFFTNYAFTAPLVQAVRKNCRLVLEAIDIISHAFTLNESENSDSQDALAPARELFHFRTEMELYQLFDSVLFINDREARIASRHHPGHVHHIAPMCPTLGPLADHLDLAGVRNATPIYDLLFVGSPHPPNVNGITWFYEHIFVPYLRKHGVRLAIAGNVCSHLQIDDPQVSLLGLFDGPIPELYRNARVVVIPLFKGTGLSIKTMECLGMGCATVTTPTGARGFPHQSDAFVRIDMQAKPKETAIAIFQLLKFPDKRRRLQRAARAFFEQQFGTDRYCRQMDQVLASIGLGSSTTDRPDDLSLTA
jgi:glycosyltransferase involved in cell wall biosynthesis